MRTSRRKPPGTRPEKDTDGALPLRPGKRTRSVLGIRSGSVHPLIVSIIVQTAPDARTRRCSPHACPARRPPPAPGDLMNHVRPTFVLLHGLLCDADTWADFIGPLSRLGHVLA